MAATVGFLIRISRPLLQKLQQRYKVPEMANALDELIAKSICMESARQIGRVPPIQDADVAKEWYEIDPNWFSMRATPEARVRMRQDFLEALARCPEYAKAKCESLPAVLRRVLEKGLWGETTDDAKPMIVKGFGNIGGLLPIESKDIEDKVEIVMT